MVEPGSIRVLDILSNASATIAEGEVLQLSTGGPSPWPRDLFAS